MANRGMKKFLNIIGFGDDGDEYYDQPAYPPPPRVVQQDKRRSASSQAAGGSRSSASYTPREKSAPRTESRTLNMPNMASSSDAVRMVVLQPQSMEDTQTVIDNLRLGKPVIVNLENLQSEAAQRLLDFISGAIYALEGNIRKVSRGIFLLAPDGVDISGNIASSFASNIRKSDTPSRRYE